MNKRSKIAAAALFMSFFAGYALAENGVTNTTIRIGQTIGITGQIAGAVKELNEGANAYIDSVNRGGGVHGRMIEIVTLDDKFDPALSAKNAERLILEDRVFAMFQNRGTPHTEAILPLLSSNKVPLVGPSTGATILHAPVNPYLFNVRAKYQQEVIKAIEQFSTVGATRIALIHVDDSFGRDGLEGFNHAMTERKLTPAAIIKFDRVKPDFAGVIAAAIAANPQTAIIISSAPTAVSIIKGLREKGSKMQLMTLSNNSSGAFVKNLGPHAAGIIVSQITPPPNLLTSHLAKEFKSAAKATGATVSYSAMEGFIAAKVLVEGLQRAGKNLTRERFIQGLESIKSVDVGGVIISYGPTDHTGSEFVELTIIGKDGRFRR
ncbi:MAG: ABC transporter permease [Burkholderiales bacterium RIFCSPLOWO2_02_FULL_57_36]|nr:MAG: ABC transporter permease [Burkholderiales bacterium RIFCSPLOWO2_02_FULL_57_36]